MTIKKVLTIAIAVLALAGCGAMAPAAGADPQGAAVAAEKLRVVMVDPDAAVLSTLVSDDLSYGHSGGRIDTKASFIADLLDGKSDFVSIDITDQTVRLVGDVALVRHTLTARTNDSGKPGTVALKVLQVWQARGGQWKLIARQAVRPA